MIIENVQSQAKRLSIQENGKEAGHAYIYIIKNGLHAQPYALLEDVFVEEEYRSKGFGTQLVKAAIEEAKKLSCTKIIGTSRHSRPTVHEWYKKIGFEDWGKEFRMNLI
ncbi:GNAT family N-acetyltransferase [Candidatus Woesearchaeota archaeon]|nr:GNAT family N-acetyltransferase [Candidatus Woesearchaeota archaeon]